MKIFSYGIFVLVYYCIRALIVLVSNSNFYMAILDVGQGDSFVINIPSYGRLLVDTGFNYQASYMSARGDISPFCQLKSVFITHFDRDHVGGLDRLTRYCKNINVFDNLSKGDSLKFGDASLSVLNPPEKNSSHEENDDSIVMLLTRGNFKALLTGDAGLEVLERLPPVDLANLDVYKVSHHGSKYNNSFALINQLKPRYCIISVGKNNFGHPAQEVLEDLKKSNCKVLRTDQDGTIVLY